MVSFPYTLIWFEVNDTAASLYKNSNVISYSNRFVICSLPIAMSYVIGNHRFVNRFALSVEREFKRFLFNSVITGRSFENLSCLSSLLLSQRLRFRGIRSKVSQGIESDIVENYWGERGECFPVHFTVWKLTAPNKQQHP